MKPLALVGMPGAGKTSVGEALARNLCLPFLDSDTLVEKHSAMSIAEIFQKYGENDFRKREYQTLKQVLEQNEQPFVLATGGGAMTHLPSQRLLQTRFTTHWLDCNLATLHRRLQNSRHRPLLNGQKQQLQRLRTERRATYRIAHRRVSMSDSDSLTDVVERVERMLQKPPVKKLLVRSRPSQPSPCPIYIGAQVLSEEAWHALLGKKLFLVVEKKLAARAVAFEASLAATDRRVSVITLPMSEQRKRLATIEWLCEKLLHKGADRDSMVLAIGGGVLCDTVAFAASVFMRGIECALVPTTLLAQVDAALGGKNAVNSAQGKNMIGTFRHPKFVLCDSAWLESLPARQMRCGYAEIVKHALITDAKFFAWLERNGARVLQREPNALHAAIVRSLSIKARIVEQDEKETRSQRARLNFGHTFAHAFELLSDYRLPHGEAVALGCVAAFRLAAVLGHCSDGEAERVARHMAGLDLPHRIADLRLEDSIKRSLESPRQLLKAMTSDKKARDGNIVFVLPRAIGVCLIESLPPRTVRDALQPTLRAL